MRSASSTLDPWTEIFVPRPQTIGHHVGPSAAFWALTAQSMDKGTVHAIHDSYERWTPTNQPKG